MDPNEITKVIDGVYKNILENFNPSARQMISTGKAYLKSLHGASAASSMYLESLLKLSQQAQQSSLGCSNDIGSSLMQVTEVFKEIHTQHLNTLKAFYVDFLVPLETNLEKDTRVIQHEQKKFLMSHKQRTEGYNKANSLVKKMRKKSKKCNSSTTLDKEIKVMQHLEEEKSKLELFCEKSLSEALIQERRRYGFILERQASLAKHYLVFYSKGNTLFNQKLESWMKVSKGREVLPESMQTTLVKRIQKGAEEECIYCSPRRPMTLSGTADDTVSINSQLRKTKSMDANEIINMNSGAQDLPITSAGTLSRAKSDLNLMMNGNGECHGHGHGHGHPVLLDTPTQTSPPHSSSSSHVALGLGVIGNHLDRDREYQNLNNKQVRPRSLAVSSSDTSQANYGFVKALYAYLSSGENQLCFLEGDTIALIGERNKGWQFGENLRTQKTGWFPIAYTESSDSSSSSPMLMHSPMMDGHANSLVLCSKGSHAIPPPSPPMPPPPMVNSQTQCPSDYSNCANKRYSMVERSSNSGHYGDCHAMQNQRHNLIIGCMKSPGTPCSGVGGPVPPPPCASTQTNLSGRASDSLHSSNDSGFSNDIAGQRNLQQTTPIIIPPQPDIDYSDDEPGLSGRKHNVNLTGDKWLMDRYQQSEQARIDAELRMAANKQGQSPRRSLSFVNLSEYSDEGQKRPNRQQHKVVLRGKEGGIKKLLSRTKSLIFKRGAEDNQHHGSIGHMVHYAGGDSVSINGSVTTDLWGSHTSLIQVGTGQESTLNNRNRIYDMKTNAKSNSNSNSPPARTQKKVSTEEKVSKPKPREKLPIPDIPPPPPLPSSEEVPRRFPGNFYTPPTSGLIYETSSLMRPKKLSAEVIGRKVSQISMTDKETSMNGSLSRGFYNNPKIRKKSNGRKQQLNRVESFSGSEAPIIPATKITSSRIKGAAPKARKFISDDEEEDTFIDDGTSSIFIEPEIEEEDEGTEADFQVPKKQQQQRSMNGGSFRRKKVLGIKSHSVRLTSGAPRGRNGSVSSGMVLRGSRTSASPTPSNNVSIIDAETLSNSNTLTRHQQRHKIKGSIRSEVHTVELITDSNGKPIIFDYGNQIHKRLYYPERSSRFDQKSERSGNLCGPWYDLWGVDSSVSVS